MKEYFLICLYIAIAGYCVFWAYNVYRNIEPINTATCSITRWAVTLIILMTGLDAMLDLHKLVQSSGLSS